MYRAVIVGLALAVSSQPVPTYAGMTGTGNELLDTCKSDDADFSAGMCAGYISGVISGGRMQAFIDKTKTPFCTPDGVTNGQLYDVVKGYIKQHPEIRHYTGSVLIYIALRESFPCPQP